jgi:hypothetical protein
VRRLIAEMTLDGEAGLVGLFPAQVFSRKSLGENTMIERYVG